MRVLILGASGLLGSHLVSRLPRSFETFAASRTSRPPDTPADVQWLTDGIDANAMETIRRAVDAVRPDVVVNAIGIVPSAISKPENTGALEAVNAVLPHELAAIAADHSARVVHVGSDAVFSGSRGQYREDDTPDPIDDYGRTKLAGELPAPHLTLRTSLFGRSARGDGLIEWLIRQRGRTIEGFADYLFSAIAAPVLADLIATAIEQQPALEGIYHVGAAGMSKYDLLSAAAAHLHLDIRVIPVSRGRVDRRLDSTRFFGAIRRPQPTLAEMIPTLGACLSNEHAPSRPVSPAENANDFEPLARVARLLGARSGFTRTGS